MESCVKISPFEKRIHEIDLIRGLLMCLVILDHLFNLLMSFNLSWAGGIDAVNNGTALQPFVSIYRIAHFYWTWPLRTVVRWICLGGFCFVSGISSAFSSNNYKRAAEMISLWAIIFLCSNLLEGIKTTYSLNIGINKARVDFNIIGVLAFSTLTYCFFQNKSWRYLLIVIIIALAIHPLCVYFSSTSWGQNTYVPFLWKPSSSLLDQADYMPLFPYIAFFFMGALLSKLTYGKDQRSYFKRYNWERPFCFIGRHSLIIYLTHFAILIAIFSLVGLCFR